MINFTKIKKTVERNLVNIRDFSYKKGNCNLNFNLKINIKNDLKDFKECLIAAIDDIDELLNKFN